jgi:hypothetical protein
MIKCAPIDARMNHRSMESRALDADRDGLTSVRPVLASLAAFVRAGLRPQSALARAIVIVLAAKLIAVVAMMVYQFFANQNVIVDAAAISRLLGPSSPP